jgi:hypothetical protein
MTQQQRAAADMYCCRIAAAVACCLLLQLSSRCCMQCVLYLHNEPCIYVLLVVAVNPLVSRHSSGSCCCIGTACKQVNSVCNYKDSSCASAV